eukprot:3407005-Pyramimonas_sp.AAC.1
MVLRLDQGWPVRGFVQGQGNRGGLVPDSYQIRHDADPQDVAETPATQALEGARGPTRCILERAGQ